MARFQLMQRVNPEGLYGVVSACLPVFKSNGWKGRIIVVSPPIYSRFFRGKTAYAIGKIGMSVLTKGLASKRLVIFYITFLALLILLIFFILSLLTIFSFLGYPQYSWSFSNFGTLNHSRSSWLFWMLLIIIIVLDNYHCSLLLQYS